MTTTEEVCENFLGVANATISTLKGHSGTCPDCREMMGRYDNAKTAFVTVIQNAVARDAAWEAMEKAIQQVEAMQSNYGDLRPPTFAVKECYELATAALALAAKAKGESQ